MQKFSMVINFFIQFTVSGESLPDDPFCTCLSHLKPLLLTEISQQMFNLGHVECILPKGPYLPCVSMAGRALLTGYHRCVSIHIHIKQWHVITAPCIQFNSGLVNYVISPWTRWPPFPRRHFQSHFLEWNCLNCSSTFTETYSWGSNWK